MQKNITHTLDLLPLHTVIYGQYDKDIKEDLRKIWANDTRKVLLSTRLNNGDWVKDFVTVVENDLLAFNFFNLGVIYGKRMERARHKAASTNNNGRGGENP